MLSIARRILHDDGEAEEVMQTVLLRVFCSAAKFDPERASFKVWLMQLPITGVSGANTSSKRITSMTPRRSRTLSMN
jgi:hypothetical protein